MWVASGCATKPYEYGRSTEPASGAQSTIYVDYGKPRKVLDGMNHALHWPVRKLAPKSRAGHSEPSSETVEKLKDYLIRNELTDVHVYVGCYDPKEQWRRLRDNRTIGPGWRYTLGTASVIGYTILPGRVFGGDRYNPFTNSLNMNSDFPSVVLHEAAFAKNVHARRRPGTYVALTALPIASLWRVSEDVGDVIAYAQAHEDWELEEEVYHVLYPRVGAEGGSVGGLFLTAWWGGPALSLGGAAVGHTVGRAVASRRRNAWLESKSHADAVADHAAHGPVYDSAANSERFNLQPFDPFATTANSDDEPDRITLQLLPAR
jgi:hypothetical protein